jgi:hypothetical protein
MRNGSPGAAGASFGALLRPGFAAGRLPGFLAPGRLLVRSMGMDFRMGVIWLGLL